MHGYFDGGFRHAGPCRCLADAQSVQLHILNGLPHFWRDACQKILQIEGTLGFGEVIMSDQLFRIFNRQVVDRSFRAPQMVQKLIAGDRVGPGRERCDGS